MCNHLYAEESRVTCGVANCMRITGQLKDVTSQPVNKHHVKQNVYYNAWNYAEVASNTCLLLPHSSNVTAEIHVSYSSGPSQYTICC